MIVQEGEDEFALVLVSKDLFLEFSEICCHFFVIAVASQNKGSSNSGIVDKVDHKD